MSVDSLLSVAAGQLSESIAIVCSNESTFLVKSTIAYCMHNNIGLHWQMSNVSPQTVIAARTIFIVTWLGFRRTLRLFFRGTHKVRDELQLSHFVG